MTGPGASPGEMPKTPVPGRAEPELDEQLLDAILAGQQLPDGAPEQAHVVAEMLASLAGPADPGDLAAEPALRAAFARAASPTASPGPASPAGPAHPGRRRSWLPIRLSARLGAALAAVLVMLGGTVAAYAGVLPGPIQNLAHRAIDAPPAPDHVAPRSHPRSDARTLCAAYQRVQVHGNPAARARQERKLARAAGGPGKINGYCAALRGPGAAAHPGAPGHSAKAHPGHARALGKSKAGHRRNPHAHPKPPAKPKAQSAPRSGQGPRLAGSMRVVTPAAAPGAPVPDIGRPACPGR